MCLFELIAIRRSIRKILKPYFRQLEKKLNSISLIDPSHDEAAEGLLKTLRSNPNKYKKVLAKESSLSEMVQKHNEDIKKIQEVYLGFNYESSIENILSLDEKKLRLFKTTLDSINSYNDPSGFYADYKEKCSDILNNLDAIKEQYMIHEDYKKLIRSMGSVYVDQKIRKEKSETALSLKESLSKVGHKSYYDFSHLYDFDAYVDSLNDDFVANNMNNPIFDDVCGKRMDCEQRKAAIQDEVNSLTIAGAGCGKTLTICGKVKWLIEHENVKPEEILLLSYSKKSASDLDKKAKRVNPLIAVGTFHKIGLGILKEQNVNKLDVEEQYDAIIERYFREELAKDGDMLKAVLRYYALFVCAPHGDKEYLEDCEMFDDLRNSNFASLKDQLRDLSGQNGKKETLKKELVKSFEELDLANFYFLNGIEYEYERPYEVDCATYERRQYKPDFYLPEYHIYHEHYGIDKNGYAKQYGGKKEIEYIQGMEWKRGLHEQHGTTCLETYSYQFSDGTVFEKLEEELKKRGVIFHPLSGEKVLEAVNSIYQGQYFKSFINLVKSFISLYKSRYGNEKQFDVFFYGFKEKSYSSLRTKLFLRITKRIYLYYIDELKARKRIDFDDMILESTKALAHTPSFRYKYLIVDEFQDISYSRMQFLKALKEHGDSKLFAVGDDWQSIYRFSGSDIGIFTNFEGYFGKAVINRITSTYRNSQELQDIAGAFIKKNGAQIKKDIHSEKRLPKPVKVFCYDSDERVALEGALEHISSIKTDASILILGRNNHDLNRLISTNFCVIKSEDEYVHLIHKKHATLNIRFSTVHGSKGIEDQFVIIANAENSISGFPNRLEDDPLLNLVLSKPEDYEFAEERRLWYVALTRTKSYTYILVNGQKPSIFVDEIIDQCEIVSGEYGKEEIDERLLCPKCGGSLVLRSGYDGRFYGCSRYPYCDYTIDDFKAVARNKRCPACGDFLVLRKGKHGYFFGCHSYPYCHHTEE